MQIFEYQGNEVRTIQHGDEVWWVLKDVCRVLSLSTPHKVAERLEEDERNLIPLIDSMGRTQKNTIVNEPGLYSVILRSDKPEAKTFKRWVTHEVLPSIRKTGAYNVGQELTDEEKMAHGLIAANAILQNEFSLLATIPVPQTLAYSKAKGLSQQIFVNQQTRLFNENGIYEICALSRKPRARELYHHVKQFSYILHSVQVQVATTHQTQLMALQNQLSFAAASLSQIHTDIKRLQTITQYIADAFTDTYAEEQMSCS